MHVRYTGRVVRLLHREVSRLTGKPVQVRRLTPPLPIGTNGELYLTYRNVLDLVVPLRIHLRLHYWLWL